MRARFTRVAAAAFAFALALSFATECSEPAFANATKIATRAGSRSSTSASVATAAAGGGAPTISSLGTVAGVETGGTSVVITGTNLTAASAVTFGGVNASSYTVDSSTQITATAPAMTFALSSTAADNAVAVAATTAGGTGTLSASYTYTSKAKDLAGSLYHNEYRLNDPRLVVTSGNVETVPDMNGNGNMTQATAGSRPTYNATGFNGGPAAQTVAAHKWMQAALTSTIGTGRRPYIFVMMKVTSGSAAWWQLTDATQASYIEMQRGTTTWRFYSQPSSFSGTTDLGADTNTNVMLVEGGFTTGGTNAFVVEGTGGNNSRTGTSGTTITHFTWFSEYNGAAVGNSTSYIAYALVLNNEPDATLKSNLRTFLLGANFPGFTSSKMHP